MTTISWRAATFPAIGLAMVMLHGCSGGTIRGVSYAASSGPNLPPSTPGFRLQGDGVCGKISIDFGDGTAPKEVADYDFSAPSTIAHQYKGWGGKKTVKVGSVEQCTGTAQMTFEPPNLPHPFNLGYAQPRPTACDPVPNMPALRKNTVVKITTGPTVIDFGLGGGVWNANGRNDIVTDPSLPGPGMRALSLIVKVGTQTVQGGVNFTFTTNQAGILQVCVNDSNLSDNSGAWGLIIDVDESAAT
jgi:hypothetical protein